MANVRRNKGERRKSVRFSFDIDKLIASITYLASKNLPELTTGKICKLLFLADKYHLVRHSRPIVGDNYVAMVHGPVPSCTYNLLTQITHAPLAPTAKRLAANLEVEKQYKEPRISTKASAQIDRDQLSTSDIKALDRVIEKFGASSFAELRALTHQMVAYNNAWDARGSKQQAPMIFEDFFEEDADALAGAREEMIENYQLQHSLAKS